MRAAKSGASRRRVARGLLVAGLATVPAVAVPVAASATPPVVSPNVVISGGYGGGGNSGPTAYYGRDFVQLFNRGTSSVTLNGYSLQYSPSTSGISQGMTTWIENIPTVTLAPGQYYLFEGYNGGGATTPTATIPAADLAISPATNSAFDIKRDTWTMYLASKQTAISGDTDPAIVDELGVGPTAGVNPKFAAGSPAGAVSNITAAMRNAGGCTDTNNNAADFTIVTLSSSFVLNNSASAFSPCATTGADLPEAPAAGLLAVAGLATAGAATVIVRRRKGSQAA